MRQLFILLICALPCLAWSQTREVKPGELNLSVTLEKLDATPFQGEMLLLTIHGIYKRHITLEKLEQPDLAGLNWMQLGEDHWFESTLQGKTVKNMRRRMAIFPDASGEIEIGAFQHHLTLLDESDAWFEHTIQSEPVVFEVDPAPPAQDWWFPVRGLTIADDWSNAPDQLREGEGVLRVIRLSALGASPDMIPPMPQLRSPSALIFAHPEKRLVDLTPQGPVSIAFWRWTIQPRNGVSAILEPLEFTYFDTVQRKNVDVSISAQRIAYEPGAVPLLAPEAERLTPAQSRPLVLGAALVIALLVAFAALFGRDRALSDGALRRWWDQYRLQRSLRDSSQRNDLPGLRHAAHALDALAGDHPERRALLAELDGQIYRAGGADFDLRDYCNRFRKTLRAA